MVNKMASGYMLTTRNFNLSEYFPFDTIVYYRKELLGGLSLHGSNMTHLLINYDSARTIKVIYLKNAAHLIGKMAHMNFSFLGVC